MDASFASADLALSATLRPAVVPILHSPAARE
jgi:hypothetical protein